MSRSPTQPRDADNIIICPLDDTRIQDHTRCAVCTILIGPKHYMKGGMLIVGKILCSDCVKRVSSEYDKAL